MLPNLMRVASALMFTQQDLISHFCIKLFWRLAVVSDCGTFQVTIWHILVQGVNFEQSLLC